MRLRDTAIELSVFCVTCFTGLTGLALFDYHPWALGVFAALMWQVGRIVAMHQCKAAAIEAFRRTITGGSP